ncbi:hypothetical protein ACFOY4_30670 [Actinomadura syzygii]|uniref:Uncharacterized protein n=1 Tax=Actinomadura syzygii TaxID=1427538 RepID=A0A5D0TQV1_9ACTN|nr:hypothetical protein [Actinomadura syzygii]TYC08691.1 hypothetical protein FXF65_38080 [Actinomadura syzygii]
MPQAQTSGGLSAPLPIGPAVPLDASALPLRALARRLEQRGWGYELVADGDDTLLRLRPPGVDVESGRHVDLVIRDRGHGPYFAYAAAPRRPIAPVDDLDRAVHALELVHGTKPPPAPPALKSLARAAADLSERDGATDPALP